MLLESITLPTDTSTAVINNSSSTYTRVAGGICGSRGKGGRDAYIGQIRSPLNDLDISWKIGGKDAYTGQIRSPINNLDIS